MHMHMHVCWCHICWYMSRFALLEGGLGLGLALEVKKQSKGEIKGQKPLMAILDISGTCIPTHQHTCTWHACGTHTPTPH